MPFGASGASSSWAFNEWAGPQGTNNLLLVPKQGDNTKIAIDDIIVSVGSATILRLFFVNDSNTKRKIAEWRIVAGGGDIRPVHIPLAGSIISNAGERLVAEVEQEAVYITTVYETTT